MTWSMDGVLTLLLGNVWRYSLSLACTVLHLTISWLIQGLTTQFHAPSSHDSSINKYIITNLMYLPLYLLFEAIHALLSWNTFYFILN
uniref:Uncharacterized protein n=1 Tax=Arundo donax TaxID=35708 RepID=A0A0A9E0J8_ARUDO